MVLITGLPLAVSAQGNSANAHACRQGGWQTLARQEARTEPFANQGACVSYAAHGGTLATLLVPTVDVGFIHIGFFNGEPICGIAVTISGFPAGTYDAEFRGVVRTITVPTDGAITYQDFPGDAFYEGSIQTVVVDGIPASAVSECTP